MNTLQHRDGDDELYERDASKDREITLGTTMILGIFFALAVLCAVFFGFGYQLGRKSAVPVPVAVLPESPASSTPGGSKPGAGSPLSDVAGTPLSDVGGKSPDNASPDPVVSVPSPPSPLSAARPPAAASVSTGSEGDGSDAADVPAPRANLPATRSASAANSSAMPAMPSIAPGGSSMVQVAAVSHQEDADTLVAALKRRGYNVAIRTEQQDKLLHVQIGPFTSHKDADVVRQKLLSDGFNAIVKDSR